jgi:diacylglycerol kinase (ATP)
LGLVPVGTGNAFARELGLLPGDWEKGVAIIRAGRKRRVDVGQVDHPGGQYHFLNIVGAGLPVDAMATAERFKFVGQSAYTMATLYRAMQLRTYPLRLELDGRVLEQDSLFVEVSNTRYTGTSFLIAPGAELDDGLLDVTLVRRLPRMRLLRLFPTIYRGRHVDFPEVLVLRAREIRILQPADMVLAPDGEFAGCTPATIRCLAGDMEIFAP